MTLRRVRLGDVEAIAACHQASARAAYTDIFPPGAAFPTEESRARWRAFLSSSRTDDVPSERQMLAAECDGRLVGFVAFDGHELHALYVMPSHWSCGVGTLLLDAAEAVSEIRELWVLEENARGRAFYERRGWRSVGETRVVDGAREVRYRRARAAG